MSEPLSTSVLSSCMCPMTAFGLHAFNLDWLSGVGQMVVSHCYRVIGQSVS